MGVDVTAGCMGAMGEGASCVGGGGMVAPGMQPMRRGTPRGMAVGMALGSCFVEAGGRALVICAGAGK